ncbi:MAG TPA: hypothetical protein VHX42_03310 [Candidatus Babeliales bacterium]|nr:hypothetical protein [Candidatus Babeliales bacterium]
MQKIQIIVMMLMTIIVMHATENREQVKIDDFFTLEYLDDNHKNQHFLYILACHCGQEDFSLDFRAQVKPFKLRNRMKHINVGLPSEKQIMQLYKEIDIHSNTLVEYLEDCLVSQDKDGKTILDILNKRIEETGHRDCIALKKDIQELALALRCYQETQEIIQEEESFIHELEKLEKGAIITGLL